MRFAGSASGCTTAACDPPQTFAFGFEFGAAYAAQNDDDGEARSSPSVVQMAFAYTCLVEEMLPEEKKKAVEERFGDKSKFKILDIC